MTFLDIVRRVAQRTGTGDPRSISSALTATGRIATVATLTQDAWTALQTERHAWRFLIRDFPDSAILTRGVRAYTAASLGLTEWAEWIPGDGAGAVPISVWPSSGTSRAREQPLGVVDYRSYRQSYQTGANAEPPPERYSQPSVLAIDPHDQLVVWPIPDADYRIVGTYRRGAQVFAADNEEPIILPQYHPALVSAGALAVHRHDEAPANTLITAQEDLDRDMHAVRRRYLYAGAVGVGTATIGPTGASSGAGRTFFTGVDDVHRDSFRSG